MREIEDILDGRMIETEEGILYSKVDQEKTEI